MRHYADVSKAERQFGFKPEIDIEKGIRLYANWFKSNNYDPSELLKQDIVFNW
jgi:nucleoside-diphosphate-sugar epimerase